MIPILFFLLIIIVVLGIVLYVYLRQEQNKVIPPKDKYDEAWNEFYKNTHSLRFTLKSSALRYPFAFLFTFVLASIFIAVFMDIINSSSNIDSDTFSIEWPTLILLSLLIILIAIFLLGFFGKNRQSFPFIYLAIIMVLIISTMCCCAISTVDLSNIN